MREAIVEAQLAAHSAEVPVGAVVAVCQDGLGEIIARAHNETEDRGDATAHAEVLAIQRASAVLDDWRMTDTILCVTLEPCTMCAGALNLARVPLVIYGAPDIRMGAYGSIYDLSEQPHSPRIIRGVLEKECASLLSGFFRARREEKSARRSTEKFDA